MAPQPAPAGAFDPAIQGLRVAALAIACYLAYDIRLYAIREYGRIIHEFDPWFNFRATQYLADNGWAKFSRWFDYMSWYPLGRPGRHDDLPRHASHRGVHLEVLNALGRPTPCR